jgi:hypothetical protein
LEDEDKRRIAVPPVIDARGLLRDNTGETITALNEADAFREKNRRRAEEEVKATHAALNRRERTILIRNSVTTAGVALAMVAFGWQYLVSYFIPSSTGSEYISNAPLMLSFITALIAAVTISRDYRTYEQKAGALEAGMINDIDQRTQALLASDIALTQTTVSGSVQLSDANGRQIKNLSSLARASQDARLTNAVAASMEDRRGSVLGEKLTETAALKKIEKTMSRDDESDETD